MEKQTSRQYRVRLPDYLDWAVREIAGRYGVKPGQVIRAGVLLLALKEQADAR